MVSFPEPLSVIRIRELCFSCLAFLLLTVFLAPVMTRASAQHEFRVKEYEEFHDVLHPLEHEALPKKDFRRIRAESRELVKRGQAIVKLGVPAGASEERQAEFTKELKRFDEALGKFRLAARRGSNAQLKTTYSAVHDSFEMLAALLR